MPLSTGLFSHCVRAFCAFFFLSFATLAYAGVIRGTVTDTTGATVRGATVVLMNGAKFVSKSVSTSDGSFQFVTGQSGRFSLIITAQGFRQLAPPEFYAGQGFEPAPEMVRRPRKSHGG